MKLLFCSFHLDACYFFCFVDSDQLVQISIDVGHHRASSVRVNSVHGVVMIGKVCKLDDVLGDIDCPSSSVDIVPTLPAFLKRLGLFEILKEFTSSLTSIASVE